MDNDFIVGFLQLAAAFRSGRALLVEDTVGSVAAVCRDPPAFIYYDFGERKLTKYATAVSRHASDATSMAVP